MKRIGLVVKPDEKAMKAADDLACWLTNRKIKVLRVNLADGREQDGRPAWEEPPRDLVCVLVLGGDGTFLSAARWIGDARIPLLGVKFGEVGFLADTQAQDLYEAGRAIVSGKFSTRERMRLEVRVIRDGRELANETVLNDAVITKGALARLTDIETFIDGRYLTTYRADGLIVSTPTGSTAYSLAAGGPVTHPGVSCILMTPICPFTLTNRPLIIPDSMRIEIRLDKDPADVMVTFDGQVGLKLIRGDMIRIQKSPAPVELVTIQGHTYFDVLKTKLSWSGGRV